MFARLGLNLAMKDGNGPVFAEVADRNAFLGGTAAPAHAQPAGATRVWT